MSTQRWFSSIPNKQTFHYDSNFWGNKKEYNLPGGETGFDQEETKLPTYWNTSFAKICLGMKIDQQLRFVVISMQADSLHSLISDGHYRSTSLGRDTWSRWLVHKALYSLNVTKKGSMSNRRFLPGSIKLPEQELATTTIIIALMLIPESVLVQEGHTIKKTRVESMHAWNFLIMEKDTLKPWDTSLCNEEREEISPFISINNHDYQHKNTYFATHHMAICTLYDKH